MEEIIDLSQEIYTGMPVFDGMPPVRIHTHVTHEQWEGIDQPDTATPAVTHLSMGDHSGTHVDSISHMGRPFAAQTIDAMPLSMFYTRGICLDCSHRGPGELIVQADLVRALADSGQTLHPNDTVLIYTDHFRRAFGTPLWSNGPGLSTEATRWLGHHRIAAFGVETAAPGVRHVSNRAVHRICGEMGFTHYENLINLHRLTNRGSFRFIALPLKIRGGTGSPVRAVAILEAEPNPSVPSA